MTIETNTSKPLTEATCDHGVVFDEQWCCDNNPDTTSIRGQFPRLYGHCPKGCGFNGIAYASYAHYLWGDW